MNKLFALSIAVIFVLTFQSCKKKSISDGSELPVGFSEFYDKFHEDSLYQVAHIRFPLEGLPTVGDNSVALDYRWEAEDWVMHKPFTADEEYNRELNVVDSTIVIETIRLKTNEYGMERRFAKFGNDWQLIYYAAMNKLIKNTAQDSTDLN